jgi:trigger factor
VESEGELTDAALDALVQRAEVEYPSAMLDAEVAGTIEDLRARVEKQGFTWERWLQLQEKDEDALWAELEPEADGRIRRYLVIRALAAAEGIEVGRKEVEAELGRMEAMLRELGARPPKRTDEMRHRVATRLRADRALRRLAQIAAGEADTVADEPAEAGPDDGS